MQMLFLAFRAMFVALFTFPRQAAAFPPVHRCACQICRYSITSFGLLIFAAKAFAHLLFQICRYFAIILVAMSCLLQITTASVHAVHAVLP